MSPKRRAQYVFHASIEKADSGPTFLDFASPTPPYHVRNRVPMILRDFSGQQHEVVALKSEPSGDTAKWTRSRSPKRSISEASTASATPTAHNLSSRTPTPAASCASTAPPSSRSVTPGPSRLPPSASRAGTPSLSRAAEAPQAQTGPSGTTTRSSARVAARNAQEHVSSVSTASDQGVALPSLDPYVYERTSYAITQTQEEKAAERKGKAKAPAEPLDNAWWHIKVPKDAPPPIAPQPLAHPPDLTAHIELQLGDLFLHRSVRGIQLWLWTESPNCAGEWRPVLLGIERESDSRVLSLTPGLKPSWIQKKWYRRMKITVQVFILS